MGRVPEEALPMFTSVNRVLSVIGNRLVPGCWVEPHAVSQLIHQRNNHHIPSTSSSSARLSFCFTSFTTSHSVTFVFSSLSPPSAHLLVLGSKDWAGTEPRVKQSHQQTEYHTKQTDLIRQSQIYVVCLQDSGFWAVKASLLTLLKLLH